jgi:hypothetical protein
MLEGFPRVSDPIVLNSTFEYGAQSKVSPLLGLMCNF